MAVVTPWYQLGYLIPHLHADMAPYQFYKVAPDGVMIVTAQWNLAEYNLESIEEELSGLHGGVAVLAQRPIDRLVVAGVPVAAALGRARMRALLDDVRATTGIATDNDFESHIAAMNHLDVSRVALATRWPEHINEALIRYLADAQIEVVSCRFESRNMAQNTMANPAEDHELLLRLGREAVAEAPSAEALLLPGGLGFIVYAAPMLEEELGIPVLVNITSTLWAALHDRGGDLPHRPDPRWSRLLATL